MQASYVVKNDAGSHEHKLQELVIKQIIILYQIL